MKPQAQTKLALLGLGVLALVVEIRAKFVGGHSLISEVAWGIEDPMVWVLVGVLIGHIAWQSRVVYAWARGEIDYLKRGALERYHALRVAGLAAESAVEQLMSVGDLDRYKGKNE